ncbi:hypothetical protein NFI96_004586 [Prochilodus magdalenae]|nr:hypothetical protein NFI96_004586 [Prochilodus magdalenae]
MEKKVRERKKLKETDRTEGADLMEVSDGEESERENENWAGVARYQHWPPVRAVPELMVPALAPCSGYQHWPLFGQCLSSWYQHWPPVRAVPELMLTNPCSLSLNISKTKEMTVNYRKLQRGGHSPLYINGAEVERVSSVRFLGVHLTDDLSWSFHTNKVVRSARQRLFFLRRLRKFGLPLDTLTSFYRCTTESILTACITVWYSSCSAYNRKNLKRFGLLTGVQVVSLPDGVMEEVSEPFMVVAQVQAHTAQHRPILEQIEALDLSVLSQVDQGKVQNLSVGSDPGQDEEEWVVVDAPQAQWRQSPSTTYVPLAADLAEMKRKYCLSDVQQTLTALIYSGAEGNFIQARIASQLQIPIVSMDSTLRLSAVDGDPVGQGVISQTTQLVRVDVSALHSEELSQFVCPFDHY